jgi:DNA-directed RNA polymerase subunit RPC12/RpoP
MPPEKQPVFECERCGIFVEEEHENRCPSCGSTSLTERDPDEALEEVWERQKNEDLTLGDVLNEMGVEADEIYVQQSPDGEIKFYVGEPEPDTYSPEQ